MSLVRWNPRKESGLFNNEVNSMFDNFWNSEDSYLTKFNPSVDIEEHENGYTFHAELPGMEKKDIKISVKENVLSISGEKNKQYQENKKNFHRIESSYGKFQRCFKLPQNIQQNKIKAEFKNGILNISVPVEEEAKPKEIEIA